MSRKTLDPIYYENNSFANEFAEAIKTGTLIKAVPGKNIIDITREYMLSKKKATVSLRLPVGVVSEAAG